MAGKPWEKYQAASPTEGSTGKPWEKYGGGSTPPPAPNVIQEMHPDLGYGTRFLLKNLSNSPESSAEYLKKKGFEASVVNGEVVMKKPGEKDWHVLDPEGLDVGDIGDIGSDVVKGVGSTAAAAAGGLAGAPTVVGALPAAAAAGGAANASMEALRQKLGQWAGIPQDVNMKDVAVEGAAGALSPVLFGSGAAVGKIAAKSGAAEGTAALEQALAAHKGLLSRGYNYAKEAAPGVGEYFTGVPKGAIKAYAGNKEAVAGLTEEGATKDMAEQAFGKLKSASNAERTAVGKQLESEIGSAGNVDIGGAKGALKAHIDKLEGYRDTHGLDTPEMNSEIDAAKSTYNQLFGKASGTGENVLDQSTLQLTPAPTEIPDQITATGAFKLQKQLKDYADATKLGTKGLQGRNAGATDAEKGLADSSLGAYGELNKSFSNATEGASQKLKDRYGRLAKLETELSKRFKNPEQTEKTLRNLHNPSNKYTLDTLKQLQGEIGPEGIPLHEAEIMSAGKYFNNPAKVPISTTGSPTGRAVKLKTIGAILGMGVGKMVGHPYWGAGVGAGAGEFLGSPFALKYGYIPAAESAGYVLDAAGNKIPAALANAGALSTWSSMKKGK